MTFAPWRVGWATANAATTLNVYAHFLEQSDRAAADVMGRLIAGEPDEPTNPRR